MKICILDNCPRAASGYTKAGRLRRKKGDAKILAEACSDVRNRAGRQTARGIKLNGRRKFYEENKANKGRCFISHASDGIGDVRRHGAGLSRRRGRNGLAFAGDERSAEREVLFGI